MKKILFISILFSAFSAWSLTTEEKAKIVEKIYNRVYGAMGIAEEKPKFLFDSNQANKIAYMMKNKDGFPLIGFEEKAFDVCATFGARRDDAIAFLIGHEISHHHYKHHWGTEFSSAYSVSNLAKELKGIDRDGIKKFETQADERGGIFCYLAGFNTQGISEKLLRDLYTAYALDPLDEKYPTLEERVKIAKDEDSIVSSYIKVFEAGNYAMLLAEYDVAIKCYEFVIGKSFHSREIYNNLGVIYFLKGLQMSDDEEIKYIYPIEIDLESRINRGSSKGAGEGTELFEKALEKFEQAKQFDKTYSTAYLNAACVFSILKNFDEAEIYLKKAIKLSKEEGRSNVENNSKLVLAIVQDQNEEGDKELMKSILKELVDQGNDFAIYNKSIIEGNSASDLSTIGRPLGWVGEDVASTTNTARQLPERIEGVKDYNTVEIDQIETISISKFDKLICGTRAESIIVQLPVSNNEIMIFHVTGTNYSGEMSKGIKIGGFEKNLLEKYGIPAVVISSRQGMIYHYPNNKMMVFLNQNKSIEKWIVYSIL